MTQTREERTMFRGARFKFNSILIMQARYLFIFHIIIIIIIQSFTNILGFNSAECDVGDTIINKQKLSSALCSSYLLKAGVPRCRQSAHGGRTTCTCACVECVESVFVVMRRYRLSRWRSHGSGSLLSEHAGHIHHTAAAPACCGLQAHITSARPSAGPLLTGLLCYVTSSKLKGALR